MNENILNSSKAPEPVGLYPHARRVGNLLFLSGVGPRERGTKVIPGVELNDAGEIVAYDIETQCRSVFQNVRYILEDAGSAWENVVDVTVFLTNMRDDFATFNRLYAEHFADCRPLALPFRVGVQRRSGPVAGGTTGVPGRARSPRAAANRWRAQACAGVAVRN